MGSRGEHTLLSVLGGPCADIFNADCIQILGTLGTECLADFKWLERYLVSRGGHPKPTEIEATTSEWLDYPIEPVKICKQALVVEKRLLKNLDRLCSLAEKSNGIALKDAIQSRFMSKETRHVKNLAGVLQQVARSSKQHDLGIYRLNRELQHNDGFIP
ncbi:unnamed protein product [Penicillium nalgiovense]|nr:unnamed protein product [Penicillium nalgiovense]